MGIHQVAAAGIHLVAKSLLLADLVLEYHRMKEEDLAVERRKEEGHPSRVVQLRKVVLVHQSLEEDQCQTVAWVL